TLGHPTVVWLLFIFFFQAEDGIRDPLVTGVQTSALPISTKSTRQDEPFAWPSFIATRVPHGSIEYSAECESALVWSATAMPAKRSEERRVGKECRYR